jgi:hypothetical protein
MPNLGHIYSALFDTLYWHEHRGVNHTCLALKYFYMKNE